MYVPNGKLNISINSFLSTLVNISSLSPSSEVHVPVAPRCRFLYFLPPPQKKKKKKKTEHHPENQEKCKI